MVLFTNKKFIGVLTFEVSYIKWMKKVRGNQKSDINHYLKYRLISYRFILENTIFICIDFTVKYKKRFLSQDFFWGEYQIYFIECVKKIRIFTNLQHM